MNWVKKHKILTVVIAIFALIVIVAIAGGGDSANNNAKSSDKNTSTEQGQPATKVAKLNEAARDGKFEFTVSSVECGKSSVGTNEYLTKQAQGQFCLVNVNVKNIGTEAQTFDSSSQYLFDAAEAKYSADGSASIYANPSGSTFLNQINPGNSVSGVLVFDLPKDKTPVSAQLHDSPMSNGVQISLQ
jgi:hypothetical protein